MSYHERRTLRFQYFDYRSSAMYYITICANRKDKLFGHRRNGKIILNDYGIIARREWLKTARVRTNVRLDAYIIMPDHIHGIIWIKNLKMKHCRGMARHAQEIQSKYVNRKFGNPIKKSLSSIVGSYKSSVSREINRKRHTPGVTIWQRNFFEHIIRNEEELFAVRKYITNNPNKYK